jgi:Holliday junction resolvasome RuvABC endonuclease subunit
MKNYVWGLDLSLKCTGVAIFTNDGQCRHITSIETKADEKTQQRLGKIGRELLKLNKKYPAQTLVIEQGFTRFNISTQQIFRVHGLVNYLFEDVEQHYIPSLTIRKVVMGKGNIKKEEVRKAVIEYIPDMKFKNADETDAFITAIAYFVQKDMWEALIK